MKCYYNRGKYHLSSEDLRVMWLRIKVRETPIRRGKNKSEDIRRESNILFDSTLFLISSFFTLISFFPPFLNQPFGVFLFLHNLCLLPGWFVAFLPTYLPYLSACEWILHAVKIHPHIILIKFGWKHDMLKWTKEWMNECSIDCSLVVMLVKV